MTHSDLVEIGYRWVISRCSFAFKELKTINYEIPDVIGFRDDGSFVLEAKTSRSDFLCDKNKPFRIKPAQGMGDWRFYIAPAGLISIAELPPMWGLIEVNEKRKAACVHNPFTHLPNSNIYSLWKRNPKSQEAERDVMRSALRRLHLKGVIPLIYEKSSV